MTDDGSPARDAFETITITVGEINAAPVLALIGDQSVNEGSQLTFTATASDSDAPANALTFSLAGAPAGASIDPTTGVFTWTPTEAQGPGVYAFDVEVTDDGTFPLGDSETITVTVGEVNTAPALAAIGNQSVNEGSPLTFTATASDPDLPANGLTFSLDAGAPAGAAIDPVTGDFTWTPTEAQGPGSYDVTVRVTDDGSPVEDAFETITITVNDVNNAPVLAAIGNQSANEGSLLTFTATASDSDLPANGLTFSLDAGAPAGAAIDPVTGDFTWTPTEAQGPGSYDVTVRVTDDGSPARDAFETITITVNEVNTAPALAAIGNQSVDEGSLLTFTATATDSDAPPNALTFSLAGAPAGASIDPATGVFTWTPSEAQGPGVYTFDVEVADGGTPPLGDSETITVTVGEVNTAPALAAIGNQSVNEGSQLTFTASATDSDLPADGLTFSLDAGAPAGAAIDPATGDFTWTPTEAQGPGSYGVTVRVSDDGTPTLTDSETITVTVNATDVVGSNLVFEGKKLHLDLTNPRSDAVTMERLQLDWPAANRKLAKVRVNDVVVYSTRTASPVLIDQWKGLLSDRTIAPGQTVTLTIEFEATASTTESEYDLSIDFGEGLAVFLPLPPQGLPIVADDAYAVAEDAVLSTNAAAGVLANDTDPDSDPLTAVLVDDVSNGSLSLNGDGSFDYTPEGDFFGTDNFTYRANDGTSDSSLATVTITVSPVNDSPVANDDSDTTSEGAATVIDVLANDTDADGDTLSVTGTTDPANGSVVNNGDGTITYTPGPGFTGIDSFTYTVDDGNGATDVAGVAVTVTEANEAPVAGDDAAATDEDDAVVIDVLLNDTDGDADALVVESLVQPVHGTVVNNGTDVTYTPDADFNGSDNFTYTVSDGQGGTDTATVAVTVNPINDVPLATNDAYQVAQDNSLSVDIAGGVLANDNDIDGDTLAAVLVAAAANGTLTLDADGAFTYTPDPGFSGIDTFTYVANDVSADSNIATVTITVNPAGGVSASNVTFAAKTMSIDLTNTGASAVSIEQLLFSWPAANRRLKKIKVNDQVVYDTRTAGPSALIMDWQDSPDLRLIEAGQTVTLTLEFEGIVSTNVGDYDLSIDFGSGWEVFL